MSDISSFDGSLGSAITLYDIVEHWDEASSQELEDAEDKEDQEDCRDGIQDGLLATTSAPYDIVEQWNKASSRELQDDENEEDEEDEEDDEGAAEYLDEEDFQDGICVLRIPDSQVGMPGSGPAFFPGRGRDDESSSRFWYSRDDESSSRVPFSTMRMPFARAEVSLRTAMKFDWIRLIETSLEKPNWKVQGRWPLFMGWEALAPQALPESPNLVQEVVDRHQARWDAAKINVNAGMGGFGLEGFFGIVYGWFNPIDWISLYRARSRYIHVKSGTNPGELGLTQLESQLFDTFKYQGTSEFMTVLTYDDSNLGTATLLKATLEPGKNVAASVEPVATATNVPKKLLRALQKGSYSKIKLVQRGKSIRCLKTQRQPYAYPARVSTTSINTHGKKVTSVWNIGDGWRMALGFLHTLSKEDDGIVSTIPQMMALLHLKGSFLHSFNSSVVEVFSEPLQPVPHSKDDGQLHPEWTIERGVKILKAPERLGHSGSTVTVVVMYPEDSPWVREQLLWA